jgi:PKD repeat protein
MSRTRLVVLIISGSLFALPLLTAADQLPEPLACLTFTQNLSVGSNGAAVAQLQGFLMTQYLFRPASITSYFGRITKAAVIQFQRQQSLPAAGFVGPLTRAAIWRVCTGTTNPPPTSPAAPLSASPTSGAAPLTVTFAITGLRNYSVDFGDGQQGNFYACSGTCTAHTYVHPGTYTAALIPSTPFGSVTITVQ